MLSSWFGHDLSGGRSEYEQRSWSRLCDTQRERFSGHGKLGADRGRVHVRMLPVGRRLDAAEELDVKMRALGQHEPPGPERAAGGGGGPAGTSSC